MTISSSLNAGVSGLNANATRLATISDNIANSATYGYKRSTVDFNAIVTGARGAGYYSAGGVRTSTFRLIDQRGPLISTANSTDLAVNGRGMLPVTNMVDVNAGGNLPLRLMTTGSFRPDDNGILRHFKFINKCREVFGKMLPVRINCNGKPVIKFCC